jgi:hypothetical protein
LVNNESLSRTLDSFFIISTYLLSLNVIKILFY